MHDTTDDATLVATALRGDQDAVARIYDRYADRIHDMCVHMLGDRDEAADVTGEVFLVAVQRLSQLRQPERLKAWLFAIARHEVYRRTRRRSRVQLTQEVDDMDRIATDAARRADTDDAGPDPEQLAALLRDAAQGLDDKDRMVMELQLQGLDGEELAAALGTSVSTGYQQVHRMKERLGRSLGAVLVARQGRADCEELDRLLVDWDGGFSVLWRKRVARHVDGCDVCDARRRAASLALFGGAALAVPLLPAGAVSAAPASVRARVLAGAPSPAVSNGGRWRVDGFPPADDGSPRRTALVVAAVAALVLLVVLLVSLLWPSGEDGTELLSGPGTSATTSSVAPSGTVSTTLDPTPTAPPAVPLVPDPAPSTTVVAVPPALPEQQQEPEPVAPLPVDPLPTPPLGPGPEVRLTEAPSTVFHPTPGVGECGASGPVVAVAAADATSVGIWWGRDGQIEGIVELARVGSEWRGVLEVPPEVSGTITMLAVAVDALGRSGVSDTRPAVVAPCPTPG